MRIVHVITRLMRAATGTDGLHPREARSLIRAQFSDADSQDLVLFEDLLGVRDPEVELPRIDPDARLRRSMSLRMPTGLTR